MAKEIRYERPPLAASQIAAALERGKARAAAMSANTPNRPGRDFTKDRHNFTELSNEEIILGMRKTQEATERTVL
ncbi:MAG: hypothetical protein LBC84_09795 [Prevotellaceae bacterium]|nr:hypothetical protein [Prevotellaceae bacterium]